MRYFETRKARIEIIPMIDIMLFLLVFFAMMTLRMMPASGQSFRLPGSSTASTLETPKLLVEIASSGSASVQGHVVSVKDLTAMVQARTPSKLAVTIAGADDASLQHLMLVIDAIRTGGATQIGLAARQTPR